jgi:hypothetical protein
MSKSELLMAFTVGTALLALWSYVRWPGAAPATMKGAVVRALIALVLMQAGAGALGFGLEAAPTFAVAVVVGIVVPVLTYTFLASMWFMKVCADQLGGRG